MIEIKTDRISDRLKMPWKNMITIGRAYELLRKDLLDHLRKAQKEIGYKYIRFHGVFHDDMDVYQEDENGIPYYHWHHIDKIYDSLLEIGLKPFVELNPMPKLLATGDNSIFWWEMNVTPPKSYEKWGNFMGAFIDHLVDRYGEEEVSSWYFEVWNEPNLAGFWSGTKEEYFKLYQYTAEAIKSRSHSFKVGGPATSKCEWVDEFINFCYNSKVPVDFITTHLYPQDEYVCYPRRKGSPYPVGMFFIETVKNTKKTIKNSPMPELEFHFTEWNPMSAGPDKKVDWTTNSDEDHIYGAAQVTRLSMALDDVLDSFGYWTVSDVFEEGGVPAYPYNNNYGLFTIRGVEKAVYNAFRLMNKMKGGKLDIAYSAEKPEFCDAAATMEKSKVHLLLWNFHPYEEKTVPKWEDSIKITLPAEFQKKCKIIMSRIAERKGSAYETWIKLGQPINLAPEEEELLASHAKPEMTLHSVDLNPQNEMNLQFNLKPKEILYIQITPTSPSIPQKNLSAEEHEWDIKMGME